MKYKIKRKYDVWAGRKLWMIYRGSWLSWTFIGSEETKIDAEILLEHIKNEGECND